nr:DUF305 domain-containing protein [Streptomyces sp. HNM0574]
MTVAGGLALVAALLTGAALSPGSEARTTGQAPGTGQSAGQGRTLTVPAEDSVAVGFSRDMAVHHQQAVEMSFRVLRNGADERVRTLAYDIAQTQAAQRGMMLGWLDLWGRTPTSSRPAMAWMHMPPPGPAERRQGVLMPGMATRDEMTALDRTSGTAADRLFLKLMTEHHRGGVHMAEGVREGSAPEPVVRLARGMAEGQRSEIRLMRSLAARLG